MTNIKDILVSNDNALSLVTLAYDLHKLLPGDEAVVVEIDPPEGELHPVLGVGRHLGAAAQEPAAALTVLNSQ